MAADPEGRKRICMTDTTPHSNHPGSVRPSTGPFSIGATLPADPANVAIARSIAATVGSAIDFDVDTIADLRMAVDEMASILVTRAVDGSALQLSFIADDDLVTVTGTVAAAEPVGIDQAAFGWMVLSALVRDVTPQTSRDADGGTSLSITVTLVADRS